MASSQTDPALEIKRLRHCMNDLVAMLALPAVWRGRPPAEIAGALVKSLVSMLNLEFSYAKLRLVGDLPPIEVLETSSEIPAQQSPSIFSYLTGWQDEDAGEWTTERRFTFVDRDIWVLTARMGVEGELGFMAAGFRGPGFPDETRRLILNVAANQAAVGIQQAQLLAEQQRMTTELDRRIAERTADLEAANHALRSEIAERKEIEQRLLESEAFLLEAQRLSHTGSWKHDLQTDRITVTPEMERIFAFERIGTSVSSEEFFARIHPDDRERQQSEVRKAIVEKRSFASDYRILLPGGAVRHIHNSGHPQWGDAGEVIGFTGTAIDLTEQHDIRLALQKALTELKKSEARLWQVIDTIPIIAWSNHPDGSNEFLNRRWTEHTGMSLEESHGWGWITAMHPDDLPVLMTKWEAALQTGQPDEVEGRFRRRDGVYRWFLIRAEPFRDESGRIVRWFGTSTDIDDRKRAEAALQASERNLGLTINTMPVLAWSTLPDGTADFFNQRWLDYTGMSLRDAQGWEWSRAMHPEDLGRLTDYWQSMIASGKPGEIEARLRRFDGSYRWFLFRGEPLRDAAGAIVKWYGTNTDIHDRKQAEERIRRSEAFLTQAQHLTRVGSFSWRVTTGDISWSDQLYRIFEFDTTVLITFDLIGSRVHPEDLHLLRDMIERADRAVMDLDYEHRLMMPDGRIKYLHLVAHATWDDDRKLEYIGAVQDVTSRQLAEAALTKARMELANVSRITSLGVLTASIAHEVNQPLSGIVTNASTCLRMLSAEPPNIEGALETVRRTIRDGNRASEVIIRLRALFKKKDVGAEPVDLNDATRELVALSLSEFQRNQVAVELELASELPVFKGDRIQIKQVILNLIRNASEAMSNVHGRRRRLIITTKQDGHDLQLMVQDAGTGLAPGILEKLFEPFYTTKDYGMGIGLSVSRSIIEAHGGRMWGFNNDGPGTTIAFSIPGERNIS